MAQDTHLFSVSRPRQTLGQLNLNSAIPQPASALKRTSAAFALNHLNAPPTIQHARSQAGRMSMMPARPPPQPNFTRSSAGGNGLDVGWAGQRNRASYAPGNPMSTPYHGGSTMALGGHTITVGPSNHNAQTALQRRNSTWSQQRASAGPGAGASLGHQQSFFAQAPLPPGVPADKRRLKDRQVQNQMANELEQYLAVNNFTGKMNHTLQPNAFRNPTNKDFVMIFQWLYKRIDPGYQFQKSIESEVPALLGQLRYPFTKSITKSQLTAVGGQNWYTLLGMLHWLMQLALMMDGFANSQYDYAIEEEGIDMRGDRIIFDFLSRAYSTWLECPEDVSEDEVEKLIAPHVQVLAQEFEAGNASYEEQLKMLEAENEALLREIAKEEESMPNIEGREDLKRQLDTDVENHEAWIKKANDKVKRHEAKNILINDEIRKADDWVKEALREKVELQEAISRQGISIQQIDQMNSEKDRFRNEGERTRLELETSSLRLKEKEDEASTKLSQLDELKRQYNNLCYKVGILEEGFELVVKTNEGGFRAGGDRLLADNETGYRPASILNLDMRGKIRNYVTGLRREVDIRRIAANEENEKNAKLLFDVGKEIDDKRQEIEGLQHRVHSAEDEYKRTDDAILAQRFKSDAEIEKMEKELAQMRSSLTDDAQYWQQCEMNAEIKYERLCHDAERKREELHTEIERMLDYVIKFKLNIQERLEAYDTFIYEELQHELIEEEGSMQNSEKSVDLGKVEEEEDEQL